MLHSELEIPFGKHLTVARTREEDIVEIAPRMRKPDVDEVWAMSRKDPVEALISCYLYSDMCFTMKVDGRAEAMFGVNEVSAVAGLATPWFLGTDAVHRYPAEFLRGSRKWVDMLMSRHEELRNYVDDRNVVSQRWLAWLGFELTEPVTMGYDGARFRQFSMKRDFAHV